VPSGNIDVFLGIRCHFHRRVDCEIIVGGLISRHKIMCLCTFVHLSAIPSDIAFRRKIIVELGKPFLSRQALERCHSVLLRAAKMRLIKSCLPSHHQIAFRPLGPESSVCRSLKGLVAACKKQEREEDVQEKSLGPMQVIQGSSAFYTITTLSSIFLGNSVGKKDHWSILVQRCLLTRATRF